MTCNNSKTSILAAAALISVFSLSLPAHADNSDPVLPPIDAGDPAFPTCDPRAFMMKTYVNGLDVSGGQLVSVDLNSPPPTLGLIDIGPELVGYTYNAMAYNPLDDFLYAIKQNATTSDNKDLLRIGSDGIPKYVATLPHLVTAAIVAEFDSDGFFYVMDDSLNLFKYDLSGPTPQMVLGTPFVSSAGFQDFGFYDGALWAISTSTSGGADTNYRIVKLNIDGPVITEEVGTVKTAVGRVLTFTSVFAAQNGIYAYDTRSGNFVKLDMSSNDINQMELQFLAQGPELPGSDGAKCQTSPLGLPAEIVVTKTSPQTTLVPGEPINYTITVENQGPWGATDIALADPLPQGATGATWSCAPGGGTASCFPTSGTGDLTATINLPEKDSFVTFEMTVQMDPGVVADVVNTATITVPVDFTDDPSNNVATFETKAPLLELVKTGRWIDTNDNGAPEAGEPVEFTFTVTNGTTSELTNVTITDPLVSAVTPPVLASLPAGQSAEFTANYPLTAADITNERITNVAFASGSVGTGTMRSDDATAEVALPPPAPLLHTEKKAIFLDDLDPNQLPDVGERLEFQVTVRNLGNVTMTVFQPIDEGPTVNGQRMTGTMTPFLPESQEVPRNEERVFTAYYYLTREDIDMAAGLLNAVQNVVDTPASTPQDIAAGVPPKKYPLPEPAVTTLPGYSIDKNAQVGQVMRGQQVPYVIKVTPNEVTGPATLVDRPPQGFVFLPGSARVDGQLYEPKIDNVSLIFDLNVMDEVRIDYVLVATGAVSLGKYRNRAQVFQQGQLTKPISVIASDEVEVIPDPIFDCGDIIGKVFDDRNRNGYQDKGEPGLAGARVATLQGMLITTDKHGRFNVACADLPDGRIGSTYLMKLDPRSLPTGYRIISENPRSVRLTAGKVSSLNFATSISRVIRLDVNDAAFLADQAVLRPEWDEKLAELVEILEAEPSVLRLSYIDGGTERRLARQRLTHLRSTVSQLWKERPNRYRLEIEARMITASGMAASGSQ